MTELHHPCAQTCSGYQQAAEEATRDLRKALTCLMDANRVLFRSSMMAGFRAGQTNFFKAWKRAEEALNAAGGRLR